MITCENCGHQMSNHWANITNVCPLCNTELTESKETKEVQNNA